MVQRIVLITMRAYVMVADVHAEVLLLERFFFEKKWKEELANVQGTRPALPSC